MKVSFWNIAGIGGRIGSTRGKWRMGYCDNVGDVAEKRGMGKIEDAERL